MDTKAMATKLYDMCSDMDYADHEETREQDIADLDYALFWLKCASENKYNHDGYKALFTALAIITEED